MDESCTVLVTSCDAYRDVESPFLKLFRKYWPDCPFELALLTETEKSGEADSCPLVSEAQVFEHVIYTGKGKTWSQMLVEALDRIETPYVIMLMNDYFLESKVDTELILRRLSEAKEKDALNYRLCPDPPRAVKNTAYSVSCKAGIWNRKFLRDLAAKTKSAWEFERYGSYMFDESDPRPLLVTEKQEFPFLDVIHKGYWEPWGVELLKREGIAYDFSRRGTPPASVRLKEWVKNVIFRLNPDLVTRIQNVFNVGAKGRPTKTPALCDCNPDCDMVTSSHAEESCTVPNDQWRDDGRVYPFAAAREQAISDLSRIRVLAQELSAELVRTVQHGTGASVRETGLALVAAARRTDCFIPYSECEKFGDLKRRRSGESEVYAGADYKTLIKVKDPTAKAAIKRTSPDDWLYEHIVHNVLFPEARYEFLGITESVGAVRIVLRQQIVDAVSFPSEDKIAAELRKKGLRPDERYFYGNAFLAVTDVGERSDNVLLGSDGKVCFIDPLIRLKKPATEVIEALVGPLDGLKE